MTDFDFFPTLRASEAAASIVLRDAPALPEGSLAYVTTAFERPNGETVFAPLFMIRHLDWIDRSRAEATRDFVLALRHRVLFGGQVFGPADLVAEEEPRRAAPKRPAPRPVSSAWTR